LTRLQRCSRNTAHPSTWTRSPLGPTPSTGARDNCNSRGGPTLETGALDGHDNNGNGRGGPPLETDARHDNNGNGDVQGEGNCGGDGNGDSGGDVVVDDDDDDGGSGDNNENGSNEDDNIIGDNDDDSSDDDDNGGNGGDGDGGCVTATVAGIDIDTGKNQLKEAMDNGHRWPRGGGRVHDQRRPWFPHNFLVSFFAFAFCIGCALGATQSVW